MIRPVGPEIFLSSFDCCKLPCQLKFPSKLKPLDKIRLNHKIITENLKLCELHFRLVNSI